MTIGCDVCSSATVAIYIAIIRAPVTPRHPAPCSRLISASRDDISPNRCRFSFSRPAACICS